LGIDRDRLRSIIAQLQQDGYITTEKIGNKLKLQYNRGLFNLKGIVENEEGRKIAMKVMVNYLKQGYTITRGKQEGDIRPDLVAFAIDRSTFRPHYDEAIAIEIESPNEIDVHPEQVKRNMQKYIVIKDLFKEIHLWTSEDKLKKLKEIYDSFLADNSIPQEYKTKVKIFAVKLKQKLEQKATETKNKAEETGEFTKSEEPESKESKQETIPALAQGAPKNANSKLGSLQILAELQIQGNAIIIGKNDGKGVVRIGDKEYMVAQLELRPLLTRKDHILGITVKNNYLIVAYDNGDTSKIQILS